MLRGNSWRVLRTRNLRLHGHKCSGRLETPALDSAKGGYAMARQEVLDRIQKYVHPFRVTTATRGAFQRGDGSASLTGRTTKRFSSCACMTKF